MSSACEASRLYEKYTAHIFPSLHPFYCSYETISLSTVPTAPFSKDQLGISNFWFVTVYKWSLNRHRRRPPYRRTAVSIVKPLERGAQHSYLGGH